MSNFAFWSAIGGCVVLVLWYRLEAVWRCHDEWVHVMHWTALHAWRSGENVCPVAPGRNAIRIAFYPTALCVIMLGWNSVSQMLRDEEDREVFAAASDICMRGHVSP